MSTSSRSEHSVSVAGGSGRSGLLNTAQPLDSVSRQTLAGSARLFGSVFLDLIDNVLVALVQQGVKRAILIGLLLGVGYFLRPLDFRFRRRGAPLRVFVSTAFVISGRQTQDNDDRQPEAPQEAENGRAY